MHISIMVQELMTNTQSTISAGVSEALLCKVVVPHPSTVKKEKTFSSTACPELCNLSTLHTEERNTSSLSAHFIKCFNIKRKLHMITYGI